VLPSSTINGRPCGTDAAAFVGVAIAGVYEAAAHAVPCSPVPPKTSAMASDQPTPIFRTEADLSRLPASDRIRYRLVNAGCRYHANDNISAYVERGEVEELKAEVEAKMHEVLRALVIDTDSDHNTQGTAKRVAKMFLNEVFKGRYTVAPSITEFPNAERLNELMIVGPVKVRSACSHHLCPILGRVWIGVMPNEHSNLIGLSKYARICDWIMSRPQIQEEAVTMLADELSERVKPDGLAIVMEADHFCMHWRGVKDDESMMTNSVMRGAFLKDATLRREFLSLINRKER
jgi:GTP cyclohydrolase I